MGQIKNVYMIGRTMGRTAISHVIFCQRCKLWIWSGGNNQINWGTFSKVTGLLLGLHSLLKCQDQETQQKAEFQTEED